MAQDGWFSGVIEQFYQGAKEFQVRRENDL